jgi:hypothetical protein
MLDFKTWDAEVSRGLFTPRSDTFKELTNAYKAYDLNKGTKTKIELAKALKKWIDAKGANWRNSTRNSKNNSIERLLTALDNDPVTKQVVGSLIANVAPPTKVIGMGKMHNARDADGRWFNYPIQSKDNSCGPCSVRIIVKLMKNEDIGEDYLRQVIEEAEEGSAYTGGLGKGGEVSSTGVHDWSPSGGGTWLVPNALEALKIRGITGKDPSVLINTSKHRPGIGVVAWLGGGLHYVVVIGPLKTKANTLAVLDPWYGMQEVGHNGLVLNQYKPIENGLVASTADWHPWVWRSV